MLWLFIALLGYFFLALVFVMDKVILTKNVPSPAVYTWYSTIFLFAILLCIPFGVVALSGIDWLIALSSGIFFGLALWCSFIAVKEGQASHINPFVGAITTIGTYFFAATFLLETLSNTQLIGMGILVFSSILFSFEKSKKHNGFHIGFVWAILSGLLFAASHVSAKYIYIYYDFFSGFVWTRASIGVVALLTLFHPDVRALFTKKRTQKKKKKNTLRLVVLDKILGALALVLIQYAIAIGNTSVVVALSGLQFAFMVLLVYGLTFFAPKIFKEYTTKKEMALQAAAVVLVVVGSIFFVL